MIRSSLALLSLVFALHGCFGSSSARIQPLKYKAVGANPEVLAVYEAWFGHPEHISVGYSSHDPKTIEHQITRAKAMGISGFVVDWYGDRQPYIDQNYALMQNLAAKNQFKVAMMYDETSQDDGATDEAIADFTMFRETYLKSNSAGRQAYLTYQGRPVIFIFPKGHHTDWDKVRSAVNQWSPAPLLIQENIPAKYVNDFDGFYAWVGLGGSNWAADGSNWGEQRLDDFYRTMGSKYPDKIVVGGAWAKFDDSKASWGLNRHISARCGQTWRDTFGFWRRVFPNDPPPFLLVETWNDHEEGTAIEDGIPSCGTKGVESPMSPAAATSVPSANQPPVAE
jgi:hypothetical protein